MRQLDLFGSLFEAPPQEQKPEEKRPALTKEESTQAVAPSYSKNSLRSERRSVIETVPTHQTNSACDTDAEATTINSPSSPPSPSLLSLFDLSVDKVETAASETEINLTIEIPQPVQIAEEQEEPTLSIESFESENITQPETPDAIKPSKTVVPVVELEPVPGTSAKAVVPAARKQKQPELQRSGSVIFDDGKITVKLKSTSPFPAPLAKVKKERVKKPLQKRGRKSFKEIDAEVDLIEIPEDEVLFQKQYYAISEVARWFRVNTSLLRYWENEFDVLKPRKNRKGDRLFRPEDVKNLQLIYQLLRQRKYTIEGAKEYIKTNKKKADIQLHLTNTLQKFKGFLLDLKANLVS